MENSRRLPSPVSNSMSSLSLPSEPPDIGIWFASYRYESPVLGTNTGLRDSASRESDGFVIGESTEENEKDPDGTGKSRCKNELDFAIETSNPNVFANTRENQSSSEVLDSSYSPSGVSEPPDIRNWLSSYVYESFVLDTNDDVKDSVSHESECEKEAAANVGVFRESRGCDEMGVGQGSSSNGSFDNDESNNKSFSKLSDSTDSASFFTEPPDVKNWFSSYVYESPVLNTSDIFGDYPHLEREPNEDELIVEDSEEEEEKSVIIKQVKSRDEEDDVDDVHSGKILEHNISFGADKQGKQSINKGSGRIERKEGTSSHNNLCSANIFKESLEGKTLQSNDMSPSKDAKKSSFNNGGSMSTPVQKFSQEACSVSLHVNTSSGYNSKKSPIMEESSETNIEVEGLGNGAGKRILRRNDKENENTENGFVATRKKGCTRTENDDMKGRPQGILLECTRNKGTVCQTGEKDETANRKVLTETTNFQHSDAMGVTGKWRCPQKSKPNRGPPLKQLRLERWVHKV